MNVELVEAGRSETLLRTDMPPRVGEAFETRTGPVRIIDVRYTIVDEHPSIVSAVCTVVAD